MTSLRDSFCFCVELEEGAKILGWLNFVIGVVLAILLICVFFWQIYEKGEKILIFLVSLNEKFKLKRKIACHANLRNFHCEILKREL